jgi:hypothetical protein
MIFGRGPCTSRYAASLVLHYEFQRFQPLFHLRVTQAEVHSRVGSNVLRVLGGIDLATFQTWNGRHS